MQKVVASDVSIENYRGVVNNYIEQLKQENDILEFEDVFGYYMLDGLVHEIKFEDGQLIDEAYESWSKEERNFVMTKL
jgi:hypothetical protein